MVVNGKNCLYESRYSQSLMPVQPDFVKLAEAFGVKGYRINTLDEAFPALEEAINSDEPVG